MTGYRNGPADVNALWSKQRKHRSFRLLSCERFDRKTVKDGVYGEAIAWENHVRREATIPPSVILPSSFFSDSWGVRFKPRVPRARSRVEQGPTLLLARRCWRTKVQQPITGYHIDDEGHWVAQLGCGHNQHVRHDPPWMYRQWVTSARGRETMIGHLLDCPKCDEHAQPDERPTA